jgi:hypothetical protein
MATFTTSALAVGSHSITASYLGDANFNGSTSATLIQNVTDFTITASTTSVTVNVGDTATITITVSPVNGFTGTVTLTPNPSTGLSATVSPTSITGGSGISTLTVSSATANTYTVTVTGMSGSVSHTTATISVQVVDFTMIANPTTLNTTPGVATTSTTINVMPVNGFTGAVSLTASISPATGLACTLNPTSITGGSGTSALSCTGTGGTYTVTVAGTSGSLSHTANVTVNVQDFSITDNTTTNPLLVVQVQCNAATITITAVGGFAGTVQLSVTSVPAGLNATLNPTSVTMSGTSQLKVCAPTAGIALYTVVVTGTSTSPSLSHSDNVQVSVILTGNICPTNTTPNNVCLNPFFSQMNWKHRLSLSKANGVQQWKFGISNPNNDTLFVQVQITGADGSGTSPFTTTSTVLVVAPTNATNPPLNNQLLAFQFPPSDNGDTFTWSATIMWGTSSTTITGTSTDSAPGIPTSGSFTITA